MKKNARPMAGKTLSFLCALMAALAATSWAEPNYVPWVFKVAIRNYSSERINITSGSDNLPNAINAANAFAESQERAFGTRGPSLDVFDENATWQKLSDTRVNSSNREYYEMIFYYGHGLTGRFDLGSGNKRVNPSETYGQFNLTRLPMGNGYTRWIYSRACSIFNYVFHDASQVNATTIRDDSSRVIREWPTIFGGGLQAVLGYISLAYDHGYPANDSTFWYKWKNTSTLFQAFVGAEVYAHNTFLGSADGLALGCLESDDGAGAETSFCSKRYSESSYAKGNGDIKGFPSYFVGRPQFGTPFP